MTAEVIVFIERNTFNVPFRKPAFEHEWIEFGETAADEVVERLAPATIAICNKQPLRAETLSRLPKLRLIAVAATGVDNVPTLPRHRYGSADRRAQERDGCS